ncbi:hypothetical protein [Shewanella pneumatophori]|uniref:DUF3379 domain-containing protein n=1 Tax=Shewanella pneumatophori TaxID=314092 RepID=A0A9X1ZFC6_9GAMM|nr:hypothetical protein [Shewanella pneumatophori]MCL1140516.1 hypothetical protein [Shewanella pneumatophori]
MSNRTSGFKSLVKQHIESQNLTSEGFAKISALFENKQPVLEALSKEQAMAKADLDEINPNADRALASELTSTATAKTALVGHGKRVKSLVAVMLAVTGCALLAIVLNTSLELDWQQSFVNAESQINGDGVTSNMARKIAEEVATNHIKMKPLEIQAAQLSSLRNYFTELDFTLVNSRQINSTSQMLGGRYCSIQGLTAAQIRFNDNNRLVTLYEVQYDSARYGKLPNIDNGDLPIQLVVRGVDIAIWVERGLLMATASSES